jgi:hypothetical protein
VSPGLTQEGPPGRAREEAAEGAEQQAVAGLEAGSTDLAFEDAELVAEGEDLDLERRPPAARGVR